jgi:hypothetical protein
MTESGNNRKYIWERETNKINYTTFYEILSDETTGIIDLKSLEKINTIIEKDETIEEHEMEFSSNFTDRYKVRKADNDLDQELAEI